MVQPALLIRRLSARDVEDYRTIRLATLATEPEFFNAVHAVEAARPIADFASSLAASAVFGAYVDGRIAGTIRLHAEAERHTGSVNGFFVDPDHRRTGVGLALLSAVIAEARPSFDELTLSVVSLNTTAIRFYERSGFRRYDTEPRARTIGQTSNDMVLMMLRLA